MGEDGSGGALHLLCLAANSGVPLFCRSSRGGAPTRQQVGLLSGEWGPPGRCSWEPVKGGGSVDIKAPTEDLEGAADGELVHTWVSKKRDEGVSPPPHLMSRLLFSSRSPSSAPSMGSTCLGKTWTCS